MSTPKVKYDGTLDIATGRSRKETSWKNRETQWSDLVKRCSSTHRTAETHAEYLSAKKPRQDEIKDIGGFVGGFLTSGRRTARTVQHRQLITLDIDHNTAMTWDDFCMLYDCAACLYSTHKHAPDAPRYRLLIPLDREVSCDEYVAISRKVAGTIDIEAFDNTTFEPSRLMYWPSTSKDGEFVFQLQDGPWLNADEVLASYHDWRDSSSWPVSQRNQGIIQRAIKKQGDPLEKPGVIGAFCRTYTIHEAIDNFLSDVYEATADENRYTFREGSTAAGLVVYDDKFAYSHHGTDPTTGKLCNAFDLVRLHKYGLKDEDAREGVKDHNLPSTMAMLDFARQLPPVRTLMVTETINSAMTDFQDIEVDETEAPAKQEPESDEWKGKMDMDRKGNVLSTIDNLVLILENDSMYKGIIAFDEFEQRAVLKRHLPWRKIDHNSRYLTDRDIHNIEHRIEKKYEIGTTKLEKALSVIYERHNFHPVKDYLKSLTWDRQPRAETLFIDYMGADDTDYTRAVTRKMLAAAVARVHRPGIKFDYVVTLIGNQGKGKSTLLCKLGKQWFSDTFNLHMLNGKEGYEQMRGAWIIEIGEMAGMAKADVERVKAFVSAPTDRYRKAFGRMVENYPRQSIFTASSNKPDFMRDRTGGRRFWPVAINVDMATRNVFTDLTDSEIDQIWAEAVVLYKGGETLYLDGSLETDAEAIQKSHTEEHPWTGVIMDFLDRKLPEDWEQRDRSGRVQFLNYPDSLQEEGTKFRSRVCVHEIWHEGLNKRESIDDYSASVIRSIMRTLDGWEEQEKPTRYTIYGIQRRGFLRSELPAELLVTRRVTTKSKNNDSE